MRRVQRSATHAAKARAKQNCNQSDYGSRDQTRRRRVANHEQCQSKQANQHRCGVKHE
jgi:hypothetical protein